MTPPRELVRRIVHTRLRGLHSPELREARRRSTLLRLSLEIGRDLEALEASPGPDPDLADRIRRAAARLGVVLDREPAPAPQPTLARTGS